jgi:hypothetical protein
LSSSQGWQLFQGSVLLNSIQNFVRNLSSSEGCQLFQGSVLLNSIQNFDSWWKGDLNSLRGWQRIKFPPLRVGLWVGGCSPLPLHCFISPPPPPLTTISSL